MKKNHQGSSIDLIVSYLRRVCRGSGGMSENNSRITKGGGLIGVMVKRIDIFARIRKRVRAMGFFACVRLHNHRGHLAHSPMPAPVCAIVGKTIVFARRKQLRISLRRVSGVARWLFIIAAPPCLCCCSLHTLFKSASAAASRAE